MKRFLVFTAIAVLVLGSTVWADAPKLINFQGRLADGSGNPVADGSYSVTFRIYNVPAGGAALWSETQSVSTTDGIFNVLLGSATALPGTIFDDTTRYLAIQVAADPEMTPRQRLATVGYSFASNPWASSGNNVFKLSGNVGIGTASPTQRLQVNGNLALADASFISGAGAHAGYTSFYTSGLGGQKIQVGGLVVSSTYNSLAPTNGAYIEGNVGIGVANPFGTLELKPSGDIRADKIGSTGGQGSTLDLAGSQADPSPVRHIFIKSGDVGIGTTSPAKKLDVVGSIKTSDTLFASNVSSNSPLQLQAPAGTTRMFINDLNGNVGIGTATPAAPLHVVGANQFGVRIAQGAGGGNTIDGSFQSGYAELWLNANNSNNIFIATGGGNAGIGTSTPQARLDIAGNVRASSGWFTANYDNTYGLRWGTNATAPNIHLRPFIMSFNGDGSNGNFGFYTSASDADAAAKLYINTSGNVGIGTTSPSNKLSVVGNADFSGNVGIGTTSPSKLLTIQTSASDYDISTSGSGGLDITTQGSGIGGAITISAQENSSQGIVITTSNNVGIGTTSPTEKLHVVGNVCATGSFLNCSDARFKCDVKPIESSLDKIEKLQGVTYRWNREEYPQFAEGNQIGFVAQEVKEVLPEMVSEGGDGTLSVDYGRFSVVLLEAIKEQQKEIKELKKAIENLQIERR